MRKFLASFLFFMFSLFLTFIIYFFKVPPFYSFSLRVMDMFYAFNLSRPSNEVTLILVDEKSVNRFGRWPWDRRLIARGLENLKDARVVALDMVFSEKTSDIKDEVLANTIAKLNNVVCGFFLRGKATENPSDDILDVLSDSALLKVPQELAVPMYSFAEANIEFITNSCYLSGTLNVEGDEDGIIRHYPLLSVFLGDVYPSLGLQALRLYLRKDFNVTDKYIWIDGEKLPVKDVLLNFYHIADYYKHVYSFSDLYDKKIPENAIKNKIVVLGISEAGITDIKPSSIGYIPGPFFHYTFLSNFLNRDFVFPSVGFDLIFMIFSGIMIIFIFHFTESVYLRALEYLCLIFLLVIASILCYVLKLYFPNIFQILLFVVFFIILNEVFFIAKKSREARFIKSMFDTYVSPALLKIMVQHPEKLKLGGEKREISVLFADIRGFTTISEKLRPEKLVELLNLILTPLTDVVLKNSGTLDKYIGDAIMAIWNAPLNVDKHPEKAVVSGWEMIETLKNLNKELRNKGFPEIKIGIGINTGSAVVGNMGSSQRFDYTAIGDTVNLASRIEGLNKVYGTCILASENSVKQVDFSNHSFFPVEIDSVTVKGKEQPVRIYTFLKRTAENFRLKEKYEKALELYRRGEFKRALKRFDEISHFPPAVEMVRRCRILIEHPPQNWNGVFHMKTK
ncbi:adenylate/guanylate cyclase domain-containing protein [Desulfurobacterium sp. TC5-1]|uniref:adenylate/guanylate cyclase domain-containing protein n=1 Tax=Desulfurobacterium sp. TC5-1 TaxID=1158318 RepID=UPI0003B56F64|nr:adenylate/guanylate cyclase domain-containing protein [Desulfurobacterium sp. TC5-1]